MAEIWDGDTGPAAWKQYHCLVLGVYPKRLVIGSSVTPVAWSPIASAWRLQSCRVGIGLLWLNNTIQCAISVAASALWNWAPTEIWMSPILLFRRVLKIWLFTHALWPKRDPLLHSEWSVFKNFINVIVIYLIIVSHPALSGGCFINTVDPSEVLPWHHLGTTLTWLIMVFQPFLSHGIHLTGGTSSWWNTWIPVDVLWHINVLWHTSWQPLL